MGVIFLFLDGVGVGAPGADNPFTTGNWKALKELTGGQELSSEADPVQSDDLIYLPVDANLDVDGLPQSGTGQAALFSGRNAAKLAGRHFGPYPHSKTRFLLEEESLFHQLKEGGYKPHFVNAYPDIFFDRMKQRRRWTCTTLMAVSAGQTLNGLESVQQGNALTAEILQNVWRNKLKLPVESITAEYAAVRLLDLAGQYDLVLFEYYLTDKAGHSQNIRKSEAVLGVLDRFLLELTLGLGEDLSLVICSDHGNLEDLSVKTHTRNPVPFIAAGSGLKKLGPPASIMDVPETILTLLRVQDRSNM